MGSQSPAERSRGLRWIGVSGRNGRAARGSIGDSCQAVFDHTLLLGPQLPCRDREGGGQLSNRGGTTGDESGWALFRDQLRRARTHERPSVIASGLAVRTRMLSPQSQEL